MAKKKRKANPYALRGKYSEFISAKTGAKWSIIRIPRKNGYGIVWYDADGEMHLAAAGVYHEKAIAINVLYYLAGLMIQGGNKITWVRMT